MMAQRAHSCGNGSLPSHAVTCQVERAKSILCVIFPFPVFPLFTSLQIGNVPTPWKYSWLIVAQPGTDLAELRIFLETLSVHVRKFGAADARMGSSLEFIKNKFKDHTHDE